ncbi:Hypothetical protein GLP15_534 [Giardia lamblia P15]|uniref:Uncharacterized protein n=1 Tax=Giardia intestinalis (strain P15) TaxID=658858 RepID=E1F8I5_GIAIA|nr:Hypothetical protein GLP15_534 [Giardia lamblia P15]
MSIVDCASHLRDIFNNTVPAFETDPNTIEYLASLLKEYKSIMQAIDEMKQILTCRICAAEAEQKILKAELEQIDPSYHESFSPKVLQAARSLSTIVSKIATTLSSNSISPSRPYGSEIVSQLTVLELELFFFEAQLTEIDGKQKQMKEVLCNLQQQHKKLNEFNNGTYLENILLHEQRQMSALAEIEQTTTNLEQSMAVLEARLQHLGTDIDDFNIDTIAKGVQELTATQQRITKVLAAPEYTTIAGVPHMSPKELDTEIDRIKGELNELIEQLEEV